MTLEEDRLLNELKHRAILSDEKISAATDKWAAFRETINNSKDAFQTTDFTEASDLFVGLQRLSTEALDVSTYHQARRAGHEPEQLMAVDAQLFSAYAEYRNETALRGFDFFTDEWSDEPETRLEYLQGLLWKFICTDDVKPLTKSARGELADTSAFLFGRRDAKDEDRIDYWVERKDTALKIADALVELQKSVNAIQGFQRFSPEQSHEFLTTQFERICSVYAIPSAYQQFSGARFLNILKSANGLSPMNQVIMQLKSAPDTDKKSAAIKLIASFIGDARLMSSARLQFQKAFFAYKSSFERSKDYVLGKGANDNLGALLELHIYNAAFQIVGIGASVKYVTLNTQLSSFLSGFSPGQVCVSLVHPRNVFFWESPVSFDKKKGEFEKFAAYASSLTKRAVSNENRISSAELKLITDKFLPVCKDIQAFHASLIDDETISYENESTTEPDYNAVVHAVEKYFKDIVKFFSKTEHEGRLSQSDLEVLESANDAISGLSSTLSRLTGVTRESLHVNQVDDILEIVEGLNQKSDDRIMVRGFSPAGETETKRLSCLPLSGQYRYLFAIHNTAVIKELKKTFLEDFENGNPAIVETEEFFSKLKEACLRVEVSGTDVEKEKAKALRRFNSAYHSAALGDWAMADLVLSAQIEEFEVSATWQEPSNIKNMVMHEVYFLHHMILRAKAQQVSSPKGRTLLLEQSRLSLDCSAKAMLRITDPDKWLKSGDNLVPLSLRVGLAQVGLATEWIATAKSTRALLGRSFEMLSGDGVDRQFSWSSSYECPSEVSSQNNLDSAKALRTYLKKLFTSYREEFLKVSRNERGEKYIVWHYLIRRISLVHDFSLVVDYIDETETSVLEMESFIAFENRDFLAELKDGFDSQVRKGLKPDSDYYARSYPLSRSILSFVALNNAMDNLDAKPDEEPPASVIADLLLELERLDASCIDLDEVGLPRQVIRAAKKKMAERVISLLQRHIDYMDIRFVNPVVRW